MVKKKFNFLKNKQKEHEIVDKKLGSINLDNGDILNLHFKGIQQKHKTLFSKFNGYILYRELGKDWILFQVNNLKEIYKYKSRAHIINKVEGRLNGKPLFIIDAKIPITLNTIKSTIKKDNKEIKDGIDLCYDAKVFYTLLQYVNLSNLSATQEKESAVGNFIKDNFVMIMFVVGLLAFLLLSPAGRKMIGLA